jgi:hypothetical protein
VTEQFVDVRTAERYAPNLEQLRGRFRNIDVKSDTLIGRLKR